ncbi:MAG: LysR substrate-binding domain-containing protein, partial [Pseudorhodoplanes sp.]
IELESGFASSWLTPRLSTFTAMHPDVRLHLNISQQGVEFSGETEIAVKWGSGYWPGFEVEWLMEAPLVPMCAPSILRTRKLRTPNDLTHHVLLHDRQLTHWTIWAQVAKVSGLDTTAGHIFQDTLALEQAAIRGHGIALYCMELGRGALERGDLVIPLPDHSITGLGDYFLDMQRKRLSTVATDFIKWLRAVIAAEKRPMQLAEPSKKIGERAYVVGSLEGSAYGKYIKSTNSTKPASRQRI